MPGVAFAAVGGSLGRAPEPDFRRSNPPSAPSLEVLSQECREREYDRWFGLLLEDAAMDRQTRDILERENPNLRRNFVEGDTRASLKAVVGPLASPLIDEAVADIRRNLPRSEQFDILQWLADESEDISRREIEEQAESLRNVVGAVNNTGRVVALAVVIAGLLLMALMHLPRPARMLGWPGITLAVGGGVSLLAGFALNSILPGRIGNAVLDRALYFDDAPVSAMNLAADLAESLAGQATTGVHAHDGGGHRDRRGACRGVPALRGAGRSGAENPARPARQGRKR